MEMAELLELEHRGWRSLCESTGDEFYGRIMTSDGVMVLAHGEVFDREQVVQSLGGAPPWRTYEIDQERRIPLGPEAAALVYRGTAYREDPEPAFAALLARVCVRAAEGRAMAPPPHDPAPPRGP